MGLRQAQLGFIAQHRVLHSFSPAVVSKGLQPTLCSCAGASSVIAQRKRIGSKEPDVCRTPALQTVLA